MTIKRLNNQSSGGRILDLTGSAVPYLLQPGETAKIVFNNVTSLPLNIITEEGLYDLRIVGDVTVAVTNGNSAYLQPNNSPVTAGQIDYSRVASPGTTGTVGTQTLNGYTDGNSLTGFILSSGVAILSIAHISTYTKCKSMKLFFSVRPTSTTYTDYTALLVWMESTTPWISLGTLTFPFAQSGSIIVTRRV